MAKKRTPRKKLAEEYREMPSGDEAAKRWAEFMRRLDDMNVEIAELADLGQTLLMALQEAAESTGSPLLGLINKTVRAFKEARAQHRGM